MLLCTPPPSASRSTIRFVLRCSMFSGLFASREAILATQRYLHDAKAILGTQRYLHDAKAILDTQRYLDDAKATLGTQCVFRQVFSVKCFPSGVFRQMFPQQCSSSFQTVGFSEA